MKRIIGISSVFIGLVIGAGFASGREIFEYFSIPSRTDFTGIVLATLSFGAISYITMSLATKNSASDFGSFIRSVAGRFSPVINIFMSAFMFCGFCVMMSACGALAKETFDISPVYGYLFLSLICFAVFCFDTKGLVAFNSVLVPVMLFGMLFVSFMTILTSTFPVFSGFDALRKNPLVSALCYVSYNTITAGAVLVPLSRGIKKSHLAASSAISAAVLGIVIFVVWLTVNIYFEKLYTFEMPLLELAANGGKVLKAAYSAVLFMALCTTAVSHGFGILEELHFKKASQRRLAAAALCLVSIPFASFGFSTLVSKLYSAFGYLGLVWTALLLWSYIKTRE